MRRQDDKLLNLWPSHWPVESKLGTSNYDQIDAHFCNLCYNQSITLSHWEKGLDVKLYKEVDNHDIIQLHTIVLVKADFNIDCKLMGSRIMRQMADHLKDPDWNALEQYRNKKGCSTQELSLNMRLVDDIVWLTHSNVAFIANNAKKCYNQIAHLIILLALQ